MLLHGGVIRLTRSVFESNIDASSLWPDDSPGIVILAGNLVCYSPPCLDICTFCMDTRVSMDDDDLFFPAEHEGDDQYTLAPVMKVLFVCSIICATLLVLGGIKVWLKTSVRRDRQTSTTTAMSDVALAQPLLMTRSEPELDAPAGEAGRILSNGTASIELRAATESMHICAEKEKAASGNDGTRLSLSNAAEHGDTPQISGFTATDGSEDGFDHNRRIVEAECDAASRARRRITDRLRRALRQTDVAREDAEASTDLSALVIDSRSSSSSRSSVLYRSKFTSQRNRRVVGAEDDVSLASQSTERLRSAIRQTVTVVPPDHRDLEDHWDVGFSAMRLVRASGNDTSSTGSESPRTQRKIRMKRLRAFDAARLSYWAHTSTVIQLAWRLRRAGILYPRSLAAVAEATCGICDDTVSHLIATFLSGVPRARRA